MVYLDKTDSMKSVCVCVAREPDSWPHTGEKFTVPLKEVAAKSEDSRDTNEGSVPASCPVNCI